MPRFCKRPVEIEAVRVTRPMTVETPEGTLRVQPGAWLVTGVQGEQYPCADAIFRATYVPVDDAAVKAFEEAQT